MKTLKRINDRPSHFNDSATEEELSALPTFRRMCLNQLGASVADNPEEAIDMYQLGLKIRSTSGDAVDLEDAEFKLLKKICEKNRIGLLANFHAQLLLVIKDSEK